MDGRMDEWMDGCLICWSIESINCDHSCCRRFKLLLRLRVEEMNEKERREMNANGARAPLNWLTREWKRDGKKEREKHRQQYETRCKKV